MKLTSSGSETAVSTNNSLTDQTPIDPASKSEIENDVLASVPRTLRKKAERLLHHMKSDKNIIDWNKRGEIIADGGVIPGTHLVDLLNDTLRKRKDFNPKGWQQFNKALARLNTPQDLVGNRDRWYYQHTTQYDDNYPPTSPGLFAEAHHLSSEKKKKKKKHKRQESYDGGIMDPTVSSTTPYPWLDY